MMNWFSGVFFFKQKLAYEMVISDWSSDVCSSDLLRKQRERSCSPDGGDPGGSRASAVDAGSEGPDHRREYGAAGERRGYRAPERYPAAAALRLAPGSARTDGIGRRAGIRSGNGRGAEGAGQRSEEPTSELQSLMRTSYAVY